MNMSFKWYQDIQMIIYQFADKRQRSSEIVDSRGIVNFHSGFQRLEELFFILIYLWFMIFHVAYVTNINVMIIFDEG